MLEGVRECVTVCDRGRGVKSMWRHAYEKFYRTYETWNLKWCLTFCCNSCILTEGGTDKTHPGQNHPDKKPREQLRQNLYRGLLSGLFVLDLIKMGGPRGVTYFGGSLDVWQSVTRGRGLKIGKKITWRTLWTAPIRISDSHFGVTLRVL